MRSAERTSAKKKVVGLLCFTELPAEKGGKLAVILQIRGDYNHEKECPESFAGGCQATVNGSKMSNESDEETLFREAKEELGEAFSLELWTNPNLDKIRLINRKETDRVVAVNYALKIPYVFLENIELGQSVDGVRFLTQDELAKIQELETFDRDTGVTDDNVVALFTDQIEALQKAFEEYNIAIPVT
jgi:8-oxo-dGTP pyrophosphatase MutT (NUDIX family)